ncbi:MAG: hypothetical protein J6T99_07755 [Oscillospiraceae bacterium]|nr:hypothetical protein [Oscillospiraceae bacterium]
MDYCARESTLEPVADACEREQTTAEIVRNIRKELSETVSVLCGIRLSLTGEEAQERKIDEPKCFHEEVKAIEHMAMDCIALSHMIADKLFGTFH